MTPTVTPTSSSPRPESATASSSASPSSGAVPDLVRTCFTGVPDEWRHVAQTKHSPDAVRIGLAAIGSDGTVFGSYNAGPEGGLASFDLGGTLRKLTLYDANVSGLNTLGLDRRWLVWSQGDSNTNMADWSVRTLDRTTGSLATIATSRLSDGTLAFGQQPLPVIRDGLAAWAQPITRPGTINESEVRAVDLETGRTSVLATGRVSNPVFAGSLLVWARRTDDGGRYAFEAVDATTRQPVPLPSALQQPGSIAYLAGSAGHFAWSSEGLLQVTVWSVATNELRRYAAPDIKHYLQFLQLAGHYLLWYGGITSSVLDLESGSGFDVAGSVAGSDNWIAFEEPVRAPAKGESVSSIVSRIALSTAPSIPRCGP